MGGWFSSEEKKVDEKMIDSNGHVNNNIIIQEAQDIHHQMVLDEKLLFATYILVLIGIIRLAIYLFNAYKRNLKKKLSLPTTSKDIGEN